MLARLMHIRKVNEGEVLTRRNDIAQTFYVILSGNFMIYFKKREALTLHERGQVIGMSTVLKSSTYRGTTVALTDGEVLSARGDELIKLLQSNAALGDKLMLRLSRLISDRLAMAEKAEREFTS